MEIKLNLFVLFSAFAFLNQPQFTSRSVWFLQKQSNKICWKYLSNETEGLPFRGGWKMNMMTRGNGFWSCDEGAENLKLVKSLKQTAFLAELHQFGGLNKMLVFYVSTKHGCIKIASFRRIVSMFPHSNKAFLCLNLTKPYTQTYKVSTQKQ